MGDNLFYHKCKCVHLANSLILLYNPISILDIEADKAGMAEKVDIAEKADKAVICTMQCNAIFVVAQKRYPSNLSFSETKTLPSFLQNGGSKIRAPQDQEGKTHCMAENVGTREQIFGDSSTPFLQTSLDLTASEANTRVLFPTVTKLEAVTTHHT